MSDVPSPTYIGQLMKKNSKFYRQCTMEVFEKVQKVQSKQFLQTKTWISNPYLNRKKLSRIPL